MNLQALTLQLPRHPGPLLPQISRALAAHGRPLRWAITAVHPARNDQPALLQLEAVLLIEPPHPANAKP